MDNSKSDRERKNRKIRRKERKNIIRAVQHTTCKYRKMQKAIKKAQKTKTGISRLGLLKNLGLTPNFIGVYAENQLKTLSINTFPCFLIINLDPSHMQGSHWLALRICRTSLEIFDPLGFQILSWPRIPCNLLNFLRRWSCRRETFISPVIQSQKSVLCGYFCLTFILCRQVVSFKKFLKIFKAPKQNDQLLINLFSYFFIQNISDA